MLGLFFSISLIGCGILLSLAKLDELDGDSIFFNKIAGVIEPAKFIFGFGVLILGVLWLFKGGGILYDIIGILAGILMTSDIIMRKTGNNETVGKGIAKLTPYKIIIGLAAIVAGVLSLLSISIF